VLLSVVLITHNEEANIARTLNSVAALVRDGAGEIIVVDSGSTDRTVETAKSLGAKVFEEPWKGFAAQKNSAIEKASGDWILTLDADEEVDTPLATAIQLILSKPVGHREAELLNLARAAGGDSLDQVELVMAYEDSLSKGATQPEEIPVTFTGYFMSRKNHFLGRWIRRGGFWPDPKLRLFRKGHGRFQPQAVHESLKVDGYTARITNGALVHHCYPTMSDYIEHMNRYSSLGAQMAVEKDRRSGPVDLVVRPAATFFYNYFFRLGFLDGREGLLIHLNHAAYVFWKYAKLWELKHSGKSSEVTAKPA
jgi:glycosyltransferase involved in cell wall biosynthesis